MREGMFLSRAPYRVSFLGGGTDYASWYGRHGGAVLSSAIDRYCYVTLRQLPPFFGHHSRVVYSRIEEVKRNSDIAHPLVRSCLQHLGSQRPCSERRQLIC